MVIMSENTVKLLISCPDQKGIVFEVTRFIADNGGNIIDSQQHSLGLDSKFFMRLEIDFPLQSEELGRNFQPIAEKFSMDFRFCSGKKRMAILVSKYDHCLYDILQKQKNGNINVEIPIIISNHPDLADVAKSFGIPYKYIPIETAKFSSKEDAKAAHEAEIIKTLDPLAIDFIAMARYMQILSANFINNYPYRIINVHHSFLPSFKGANPYKQAYEKGVKIIGATAHYATEDLDMGPIISQDVSSVNYKHNVEDYVLIGRDIEELVFARAIKAHSEDKIIVDEGKTIVFN
jgi:formyltetrahydrofolate deformylase